MAQQFAGKVALVTGAASGIGQASAVAFAREGARVVIADIGPDKGEETIRRIKELGGEALYVHADVTQASQVEGLIGVIVEAYGRLDFAHNNVGGGSGLAGGLMSTAKLSEEGFDRIIAVNLKSTWLCMKYEILWMLQAGGGAIVNTASIAGTAGVAGQPAYSAAKHGVIGLTKTAALEYATRGIRVNAVCPGTTQTPMADRLHQSVEEQRSAAMHPMRRLGLPEEQAAAVIYLCSEGAGFVTGACIPVDGGATARSGIG